MTAYDGASLIARMFKQLLLPGPHRFHVFAVSHALVSAGSGSILSG